MKTAQILNTSDFQAVKLPDEFRFEASEVAIRKEGASVVLERLALNPDRWPAGFFDAIRIDAPAFRRPDQGPTPPAPTLDAG